MNFINHDMRIIARGEKRAVWTESEGAGILGGLDPAYLCESARREKRDVGSLPVADGKKISTRMNR